MERSRAILCLALCTGLILGGVARAQDESPKSLWRLPATKLKQGEKKALLDGSVFVEVVRIYEWGRSHCAHVKVVVPKRDPFQIDGMCEGKNSAIKFDYRRKYYELRIDRVFLDEDTLEVKAEELADPWP